MKPINSRPSHLKLAAAVLAAAALTLGVAACGGSDDSSETDSDSWRIGLEAPLSGDLQTLGKGMLKGAELAADQINADGGIEGKQVEIVPIDDAADPETGVKAAKKAIDDGLDGVVGPYNSGVGIETLPLYKDAGLVPIRLTSDNDTAGFGFTLQPMTSQIAPVDLGSAHRLDRRFDGRDRLRPDPELHGLGLARGQGPARVCGVKVTAFEKVQPGKKNYTDVVEKLAAGKPDVIYAAVYYPEGGLIAKEMPTGESNPAACRLRLL